MDVANDQQQHLKLVNESGFPLQVAAENIVRAHAPGGWRLRHIEHAWKSADGTQTGFIDLVIEDRNGIVVMVIECKRARDVDWVFLSSDGAASDQRLASSWITRHIASGGYTVFGFHDCGVGPASPQASMCLMRGQSGSTARPMLERVAADVVESTEALARQEKEYRSAADGQSTRLYFSVVLTNVRIFVAEFDPSKIDLATGELSEGTTKEVPYVRFRKQLRNAVLPLTPDDYNSRDPGVIRTPENTVFVVSATHFAQFLTDFDLDSSTFRRYF